MTDTPTNTNGWPDDAREALEWVLAIHFSQNRQPCMSGDPRGRLSPMQRRNMEDARDAVLEALAPILKAREAAAAMAMRENLADLFAEIKWNNLEREVRALPLPDTTALDVLLAQAREEGRKEERERMAGEFRCEAEAERDEFFNCLGRITSELGLPMDCTASRIIEAIDEKVDDEREACASVSVRVEVPEGAGEWSPLEAWEEAMLALDEAFRSAIRARGSL